MTRGLWMGVVVTGLLVAGVVGAQQRSSAASSEENARYTLHQVTVETSGQVTAQHPEVLMIDSPGG